MFYTTQFPSPVGLITLASHREKLVGLWIENQKYFGDTVSNKLIEKANLPIFNQTRKWLDEYFDGHDPNIKQLELAPIGNSFRQMVWQILIQIPYGQLTTYKDIAKQVAQILNKPHMSAQAIGGAVGHNPISIIIPCHRVIGSNGSLTGYAGGIDKKVQLLTLEGINLTELTIPKLTIPKTATTS